MSTSKRTLIKGGTVITVDPQLGDFPKADVLIENDRIVQVDSSIDADAEVIDATGMIVMPGFIDTHRHTWQSLVRNIASDWTLGQYMAGLHEGVSVNYRPEDTYTGILLGTVEALDAGITTLVDWSHNVETPAHADAAVDALFASGARAVFAHGGGASMWQCPSVVGHDRDILRIQRERFSSDDQLVTLAFAARGPQFATREVTLRDWDLVREVGVPVTVHAGDGEWGRSRPIEWMRDQGMLADDMTVIHANTLADDELRMLADAGASVSVSADIETQMGHGWPATGRLLDVGIRPCLSIDVCSSNGGSMFSAMKTTIAVQRALDNANEEHPGEQDRVRLRCADVIEFATIDGAKAASLDRKVGSISIGKAADVILVDATSLGMTPLNNPAGAIVYNAHAGMVDTVLVNGRVVKRGGKLVGIDIAALREAAIQSRDHIFSAARSGDRVPNAATGGKWFPGTVNAQ